MNKTMIFWIVYCLLFCPSAFAREGEKAADFKPTIDLIGNVNLSEKTPSEDLQPSILEPTENNQNLDHESLTKKNLDVIDSSQEEYHDDIDVSVDIEFEESTKDTVITLSQETSLRMGEPRGIVNNRSSFRLEYSKFFLDDFFIRIDTKLNAYWSNDHQAAARDKSAAFDTNTPEAFLQFSRAGGSTSFKLGQQKLIWGEFEGGIITDEVSPRDFSELSFITLEESRLGQLMAEVDIFSSIGDWSFFYIPDPEFNEYPELNTAYYFDPFLGMANIRDDLYGNNGYEYGMRWKKTFGQSDISLMAANLIDNDYAFRKDFTTDDGMLLISRVKQRFTMAGGAFNYSKGDFLVEGEVAFKSPKAFNDRDMQIYERNVVDSGLGLTYSLGDSNSIGLELVNSHILDWENDIIGFRKNTRYMVLNAIFLFFNDTLSVNWLTIYGQPYSNYQSSIRTSYLWNDNLTLSLDGHIIEAPDERSELWRYRNQDQIVFRIQYQF